MDFEYDDSPIPVINDDTLHPDDAAALAALDDEMPTESQRAMMSAGGVLFTPSDRTGESGIPIGMPPEKFDGQRVRLTPFKTDGSDGPSVSFVLDGQNDLVAREILEKYKLKPGESRTPKEQIAIWERIMTEIAAIKRQRKSAASTPQLGGSPMSQPTRKATDVVFDFGGIDGRRSARYSDVSIDGNLLIFVASDSDRAQGVYEPPNTGPNRTVEVTVSGLPTPIRVRLIGLRHTYGENTFFLAFIDRDEAE